jgi:RNA polymerase subunit RPABC4/transcription elongation factor Spt4
MEKTKLCEHCSNEVTLDSEFCPNCGSLFPGDIPLHCDTHSSKVATGVCVVCHALLCSACGTSPHSRLLCPAHAVVILEEGWAEVFRSTDVNEAEMAKAFLESEGYTVNPTDFGSVGYVWDGGGDSSMSRSALNKPARLFVPIPDYVKAKEVLQDWQSSSEFQD